MSNAQRVAPVSTLLLLAALSGARAPGPLDVFLRGYKADALVAVAPETLRSDGASLASYDRKAVRLGSVTAIVPRTNVAFEDALSQPRNRYVGLPRRSQVLLLLGSLDANGWAKAAGPGLGLGDLTGEPRELLAAILPKSVAWQKRAFDYTGHVGKVVEAGKLSPDEGKKLRLRVQRSLEFQVPLSESGGGYLSVPTDGVEGRPGDFRLVRQESSETKQDEIFGATMRRVVDNQPKKGQLDTSALRGSVRLPAKVTVGEALRAVGAANNLQILCDARVRDLSLFHAGGPLPSGDLVDAIALAVGGAYRKIGPVYALVSDVVGLGQRQLRQRDWREVLQDGADASEADIQAKIAKDPSLKAVEYDPANPLAPGSALKPYLGTHPARRSAASDGIPLTELTGEQRALLKRVESRGLTRTFVSNRVDVHTGLRYRFVLPDGRALQTEPDDLQISMDPPSTYPPMDVAPPQPPAPPSQLPAKGPALPIVVRLKDSSEATLALREARAHGVGELWVETASPEALATAVGDGMPVHLVVRPWVWRVPAPPTVPDLNILGDGGEALLKSLANDREWSRQARAPGFAYRPLEVTVSPDDPSWPARKAAWKALASTPGLAGLVVLETQPRGYEPDRTDSVASGYGPTLAAKSMLGYTEAERLAFFRAYGIDPIDIGYGMLRGDIDLMPAFFSDRGLASWKSLGAYKVDPKAPTFLAEWDGFRAKRNASAIMEMLGEMPRLPTQVAVRAPVQNEPLDHVALVQPWSPGKPLPGVRIEKIRLPNGRVIDDRSPVGSDAREMYTVFEGDPAGLQDYGKTAVAGLREGRAHAILDFTLIPADDLGKCLDRIFVRSPIRRP